MLQNIDDGLKQHIHLMVSKGVHFVADMRPHLVQYLETRFAGADLPDRSNRRWWPTDRDVTNHMQTAFTQTL